MSLYGLNGRNFINFSYDSFQVILMDIGKFIAEFDKNNFISPDYKNSNLSVIRDIVNQNKEKRLGKKEKNVFLLIDGLGYNLVKKVFNSEDITEKYGAMTFDKVSTVFPSTTPAAMTSLETGKSPSEHGIVGWHTYSKELGASITPYLDSPSMSSSLKLSKAGIKTIIPEPDILIKAAESNNIMTLYDETISYIAGKRVRANCLNEKYATQLDMLIKLKNAINEDRQQFIFVYYPTIDHLGHLYGPSSEVVKTSIMSFFNDLKEIVLPALTSSNYNLIITADHGLINVEKTINIDSRSEIMKCVSFPPWGDTRIRYLNVLPGKMEALENYINENYEDDIILLNSESLIQTGIFGNREISDDIRDRFGTHILLSRSNSIMLYEYPKETPYKGPNTLGSHSGLTKDEMEVPLIVFE